jgi:hypothetical protein
LTDREIAYLPMRDDGKEEDKQAGDGVYSVRVPASFQKHRWLIPKCAAVGKCRNSSKSVGEVSVGLELVQGAWEVVNGAPRTSLDDCRRRSRWRWRRC